MRLLFCIIMVFTLTYSTISCAETLPEVRKPRGQIYFVTYDNKIVEGWAEFYEVSNSDNEMLRFVLKNNSRRPIDFKEAKFFAVNWVFDIFGLGFDKIEYNSGIKESSVLQPGEQIVLSCRSNLRGILSIKGIEEVLIKIGSKKIYFVYQVKQKEYASFRSRVLRSMRDFFR